MHIPSRTKSRAALRITATSPVAFLLPNFGDMIMNFADPADEAAARQQIDMR